MSAPPLGLGELGGAFCLYQRTKVFFPFRWGRKAAAGPSFSGPERRGFNYKRLARGVPSLRLRARSVGQINTEAPLYSKA